MIVRKESHIQDTSWFPPTLVLCPGSTRHSDWCFLLIKLSETAAGWENKAPRFRTRRGAISPILPSVASEVAN
jgi:hypothetical protein